MPDRIVSEDGLQYDILKILVEYYWKDKRYEYSGDDLLYRGHHKTHKAATSDDQWHVWKFTYSSGDITRIEGPIVGVWNDRATLSWG